MTELTKNGCLLEGDKETVRYLNELGHVVATCPLRQLAESCFAAIQNGRYFELNMNMSSGENVPIKLVLSRNRRSIVIRDCFGQFRGLVGLRYLGEKLNNILRGWAANFEIALVELQFTNQAPSANPELLGPEIEKGDKRKSQQ